MPPHLEVALGAGAESMTGRFFAISFTAATLDKNKDVPYAYDGRQWIAISNEVSLEIMMRQALFRVAMYKQGLTMRSWGLGNPTAEKFLLVDREERLMYSLPYNHVRSFLTNQWTMVPPVLRDRPPLQYVEDEGVDTDWWGECFMWWGDQMLKYGGKFHNDHTPCANSCTFYYQYHKYGLCLLDWPGTLHVTDHFIERCTSFAGMEKKDD